MTDIQPESTPATAEAEARVWALLFAQARQAVAADPELGAKTAQLGASPGWDSVIINEIDVPVQPPTEQPATEQPAVIGMPSLAELLDDSAIAQAFESAIQGEVKRLREADPSLDDIPDDQLVALLTDGVEADYQRYVEQGSGT